MIISRRKLFMSQHKLAFKRVAAYMNSRYPIAADLVVKVHRWMLCSSYGLSNQTRHVRARNEVES